MVRRLAAVVASLIMETPFLSHSDPDHRTAPATAARQIALTRLHDEIAACQRCVAAGYIPSAHPIFKGTVEHRLMVLGQAPAEPDRERPRPYMGASGRTLRTWLSRAGFDEAALYERCYLTSLTKCFPGSSPSGKGDRAPSAREIGYCRDHLARELALIQPEIIITLGRLAAVALLGNAALSDLVGTLRPLARPDLSCLVLPLPHPSGVSRWLNDPVNQGRHQQALALLAAERIRRGL